MRNFQIICLKKGSCSNFADLLEMDFPTVKQPVHFYGPDRSGAPQILVDCEKTIQEVDAIVVVTPEYNNSIPASLKNFLDAFPDSAFGFKPSGITCYSQGRYLFGCELASRAPITQVLNIHVEI